MTILIAGVIGFLAGAYAGSVYNDRRQLDYDRKNRSKT